MQLDLTAQEAQLLHSILRSYLSDLRMEIVDTDSPRMRRDLREESAVVNGLADRLMATAQV